MSPPRMRNRLRSDGRFFIHDAVNGCTSFGWQNGRQSECSFSRDEYYAQLFMTLCITRRARRFSLVPCPWGCCPKWIETAFFQNHRGYKKSKALPARRSRSAFGRESGGFRAIVKICCCKNQTRPLDGKDTGFPPKSAAGMTICGFFAMVAIHIFSSLRWFPSSRRSGSGRLLISFCSLGVSFLTLVPKLLLGNPFSEAPASNPGVTRSGSFAGSVPKPELGNEQTSRTSSLRYPPIRRWGFFLEAASQARAGRGREGF